MQHEKELPVAVICCMVFERLLHFAQGCLRRMSFVAIVLHQTLAWACMMGDACMCNDAA